MRYKNTIDTSTAYCGKLDMVENQSQYKHLDLVDAVVRLEAFGERLSDFQARLVGEERPINPEGKMKDSPCLAHTLDYAPREINVIIDSMSSTLDTINAILYNR